PLLLSPVHSTSLFFFFHCSAGLPYLPSFPTRRSSDLLAAGTARFVASKDGFVEAASGDLDLAAGQTTSDVRLELARGGEIWGVRSEEHTSELQSLTNLLCRLLL